MPSAPSTEGCGTDSRFVKVWLYSTVSCCGGVSSKTGYSGLGWVSGGVSVVVVVVAGGGEVGRCVIGSW